MVRVLMFGAEKYDDHNWKKGLKYTEVCESMMRHIYAFLEGEDNDPESKLAHVGHILCNAMFLSFMFLFRKDFDDRHKSESCCEVTSTDKEGDDALKQKIIEQDELLLYGLAQGYHSQVAGYNANRRPKDDPDGTD